MTEVAKKKQLSEIQRELERLEYARDGAHTALKAAEAEYDELQCKILKCLKRQSELL